MVRNHALRFLLIDGDGDWVIEGDRITEEEDGVGLKLSSILRGIGIRSQQP